jgi:hypothetical protein
MLTKIIASIDRKLRAQQGIVEYSACPRCIFRMQLVSNTQTLILPDHTVIPAGARLIDLHLWNEHIPPFSGKGPTLGWARRVSADLELSLRELARLLAEDSALEDVAAISAKLAFGSAQQSEVIAHLAERFGFLRAIGPKNAHSSPAQRLHQAGENILISLLVISHNPAALRPDSLWRSRVRVFLSRRRLMDRFWQPGRSPDRLVG